MNKPLEGQPPQQQNQMQDQQPNQPAQPPNVEIIQQARRIIIDLYGEEGYTLGDDGFVPKRRYFKHILQVTRNHEKALLVTELQRRYKLCRQLNITTDATQELASFKKESMPNLRSRLKEVAPSAICTTAAEKDELNRKKRQVDAILSVNNLSHCNDTLEKACTAVWRAMQNPEKILFSKITPQEPILDEPMDVEDGAAADEVDKDGFAALITAILDGHVENKNHVGVANGHAQQPSPGIPKLVEMPNNTTNGQLKPPPAAPPAHEPPAAQDAPQDTGQVQMTNQSKSDHSVSSTEGATTDSNRTSQASSSSTNKRKRDAMSDEIPNNLRCFGIDEQIDIYLKDTHTKEQLQHELDRRLVGPPPQQRQNDESVEDALKRILIPERDRETALIEMVLDLLEKLEEQKQRSRSNPSLGFSSDDGYDSNSNKIDQGTTSNNAQPQHAPARQPSNDEIIQQTQDLMMYLYGEEGYTVGDGDFAITNKAFKKIMKLPNKRVFMDEVKHRHDLCSVCGINPGCERPHPNIRNSHINQLRWQLRKMRPGLVHSAQEINRKKRQMDAVREVVRLHDQDTDFGVACLAVWMAMENPDRILGSEMPPQPETPDEPMDVEDGAAADQADKDGFTALDNAILDGDWDVVKELCKEMNIETYWLNLGSSSLHWAAYLGRVNVVKELIGKGGDMEVKDNDGYTPLHQASWKGKLNVVQFLVENKADINAKNNSGETPLHDASKRGHLDVLKFLVESKADIHATNDKGETPLHWASYDGHLDIVKFLVENKADINAKDNDGRTPLHRASYNGHLNVAKFLVESKANINAKDIIGWTPLHSASFWGHLDVAKFLVENKADIHTKNNDGWTPLDVAKQENETSVADYIQSKGAVE